MKAYKGFNKDMTCRGFRFEEGKEYHEENASLCNSGFHACENPLDCYNYYGVANSVFHEVEIDDLDEKRGEDSKVCGKTIKIGARLSAAKICEAHFEYVKSHTTHEVNAGDNEGASAGAYGSASAGASGSASAGAYGSASAGESGSASAGWKGSASAGESGSASAGESGSASAGWKGSASAGEYGSASAGESGKCVSGGSASVGKNGCAVAKGNGCKVRGGVGSVLIIAEENNNDYAIKEWKAVVVDGKNVKADTWYKLENGELVEVVP